MSPHAVAAALAKSPAVRRFVAITAGSILALPLLASLTVLGLFAGSPEATCAQANGGLPPAAGQTAQLDGPLQLQPGQWYPAGATYYSADERDQTLGAIPIPGEAQLAAHPDTFAELSTKTVNSGITFDTADALGRLPWLTGLRVKYRGRSVVVYKRDIGFGQGAKTIEGQRFRIDLWGPAAEKLGVSSNLVQLQLAPRTGAAATTGDLAIDDATQGGPDCATPGGAPSGPLPLTKGDRAELLPSGRAAAPADAPKAVKLLIAAGNELVGKPYVYGGAHGPPLTAIQPGYDCSSSVSRMLHLAGLFDSNTAWVSGALAGYGMPGYGKWVSVLANDGHVYMYVAGLRFDTHRWGSGDQGVAGIGWHTAKRPDTGFTPRHPGTL